MSHDPVHILPRQSIMTGNSGQVYHMPPNVSPKSQKITDAISDMPKTKEKEAVEEDGKQIESNMWIIISAIIIIVLIAVVVWILTRNKDNKATEVQAYANPPTLPAHEYRRQQILAMQRRQAREQHNEANTREAPPVTDNTPNPDHNEHANDVMSQFVKKTSMKAPTTSVKTPDETPTEKPVEIPEPAMIEEITEENTDDVIKNIKDNLESSMSLVATDE